MACCLLTFPTTYLSLISILPQLYLKCLLSIKLQPVTIVKNNLSNFIDQLKTIDWSFFGEYSDPNTSYNSFLKVLSDTYDKCCPLKMIKKKHLSHKSWLSKGLLKIDGKDISDPLTIANKFCEYFSNIGPSLAKESSYRVMCNQSTATENKILTITNSFLIGKASGHDSLPMSVIKRSIDIISEPLTSILNLSLAHGIVPQ